MTASVEDFISALKDKRINRTKNRHVMLVRKATPDDSKIIAACLLLAMEEIIYTFIGARDPEKAREFMVHFVAKERNQYSWQNCWVVENDRKVIAAINVYNGAQLTELRQPIIEYLTTRFNKNLSPEDETQAGEYYIDSFGVNPDQRSKGIGTKLLQFIIDEYVHKHKQPLGLLVDEDNPPAKRLYVKLGFTYAGKKAFLGRNMEHLQLKG